MVLVGIISFFIGVFVGMILTTLCVSSGNYNKMREEKLNLINRQPIAYDINEVVRQLKNELNLANIEKRRCIKENALQFDEVKGYARGISYAIETVKGGDK